MVCEFEGRTLPFVRERPYQLLAVLAARAGWVERDELAALFWSRDDAGVHRRNLSRVLHAARHARVRTAVGRSPFSSVT